MNRSLWALPVGVVLAIAWCVYALNSAWYSEQVAEYGEETTGLCLGGPAMVILMLTFFVMEGGRRR